MKILEGIVIFLHFWAACRAARLYWRVDRLRDDGKFVSYCHRDGARWALWGMILCGGYGVADLLWMLSGDYHGFGVPPALAIVFVFLDGFAAVMVMEILRVANGRITRSFRDHCKTCLEWPDATL